MTLEERIEHVLAVIDREVGPVGLIARVEITKALDEMLFDDDDPFWDDDDPDPEPPEPDPPPPPDPGPSERRDLHTLLGLDAFGRDYTYAKQTDMLSDEVPV